MDKSSNPVSTSYLYQKYNGIVFGFFSQMGSFRAARDQWPGIYTRLTRFGSEIDLGLAIETDPDEFSRQRGLIFEKVMDLSDSLNQFKVAFGLGYAYGGIHLGDGTGEDEMVETGASALDLNSSEISQILEEIGLNERRQADFDQLMNRCLDVATKVIARNDYEENTCFVSMPFREPFLEYFNTVYSPWLNSRNIVCLRGWGAMRNEIHLNMMLTLIDRCGWLLADLTDSNPNVAYELGFATGKGKKYLALMDENPEYWINSATPNSPKKLSNLRGFAVAPYDSRSENWPGDFLQDIGKRYLDVSIKNYEENAQPFKLGFLNRLGSRVRSWVSM